MARRTVVNPGGSFLEDRRKWVGLAWLEKWCKKHEVKEGYGMMPFVFTQDLIKAAKRRRR